MIPAILMGREGSKGFPGKNLIEVLGRPLMEYPLTSALAAKSVDSVYVTTDSETIKSISKGHGAEIIHRPAELCTSDALGEHVFVHAYEQIKERVDDDIEIVVLLLCNVATVTSDLIERGIAALRDDPSLDSAVSVSRYNMWSPLRARQLDAEGLLKPMVPFESFGDPATLSCDRDSQGDVWFADMGVSVIRPRCLENLEAGLLPQKWMGQRIHPLFQDAGCDVDYEWQLPGVEWWIKKYRPDHD